MSDTAWFADGLRGRHVLLGLVAFFGLIFLVNGIFIYYALTTFGGGDTSDPYRKGLNYNETVAEAARDAELGWQAQLTYGTASGRLMLSLTDRNGHASVRPALQRHDRQTRHRPRGPLGEFQ